MEARGGSGVGLNGDEVIIVGVSLEMLEIKVTLFWGVNEWVTNGRAKGNIIIQLFCFNFKVIECYNYLILGLFPHYY